MNRLKTESIRTERAEPHKADLDPALPSALDMALATEEEILPTSGFLASVMDRVQEEAARVVAPTPISFPWKRAIPGILLALAVFGWGGFELTRPVWAALTTLKMPLVTLRASDLQPLESAGWVAGALAISLLCWLFSRTLTRRSGLL
jgi:hypothetical protein